MAADGGCSAADCEAVGLANKLDRQADGERPTLVPAEVRAAPEVGLQVALAPAAPSARTDDRTDDGPAAELKALQAQLAALKAAAGQQ